MQQMLTQACSTPSTHRQLKARQVGFLGNSKCPLWIIISLSQIDSAKQGEERGLSERQTERGSSTELPGFLSERLPHISPAPLRNDRMSQHL